MSLIAPHFALVQADRTSGIVRHHWSTSGAPKTMIARLSGFFIATLCILVTMWCSSVVADEIRGTLMMPDSFVVPTTKVVLNGGQHWAMTARDGSFTFRDVSPGVYLLEVLSTTYHYSSMKIKLDDQGGLIVVEYKYPGASRKEVTYPLRLTAHTKWYHFEKREGMKVGGMLRSPMTIMMIATMGLMIFLPRMMANLDPEQLEEIQGQQKAVAASAGSMSFSDMLSNALAGNMPEQPAPQAQRGAGAGGGAGAPRSKRSK